MERFDLLALTLGSTKRWPKAGALIAFARSQCDMTDKRAKELLAKVAHGVQCAANEVVLYMQTNSAFQELGTQMLAEW